MPKIQPGSANTHRRTPVTTSALINAIVQAGNHHKAHHAGHYPHSCRFQYPASLPPTSCPTPKMKRQPAPSRISIRIASVRSTLASKLNIFQSDSFIRSLVLGHSALYPPGHLHCVPEILLDACHVFIPRPDRLTMRVSSFPRLPARLIASARHEPTPKRGLCLQDDRRISECFDSFGSFITVYSTRPVSFNQACSGPTPDSLVRLILMVVKIWPSAFCSR